jgi:hypothetical protein
MQGHHAHQRCANLYALTHLYLTLGDHTIDVGKNAGP